MKISPLPFRPLALFVLLAACRAHGESATWTGAAAVPDNLWPTIENWTLGIASVPGTNPGETATFSGTGIAGLNINVPVTDPPATTLATVKFLNFNGLSQHTFALPVTIEDGGAVTIDAATAAQSLKLAFAGDGTITNNGDLLTSTVNLTTAAGAGKALKFDGPSAITVTNNMGTTAGGVVKNGTGTTTFSANNSGVGAGGFKFNAGTAIAGNINGFSNKVLYLNGGNAQMNANGTANYTGAVVSANSTLSVFNPATGVIQWGVGQSAVANVLSSTGALVPPVLTFVNAGTVNNYISMNLTTAGFDGTWKVGTVTSGCQLYLNSTNSTGGPNVRVDLGEAAATGLHVIGTSTALASGTNIVPVVIGELKGANTGALLAGRRNQGTRTTGTRYEVGGLGTNTSFSGIISDGVNNSNGLRQMNGNPDCTASAAPDTVDTYIRTDGIAGAQGTVEFVKTGAGTLTLLSNNSYSGGTVLQGGVLAISGDGSLGAAYDGSLRPFSLIPGATLYTNADLPDTFLTGGNPTVPATAGMFSSIFGNNANANNYYLSFSAQNNDTDNSPTITSILTGSGYTSIPTVSFTGGTPVTPPATPPVATVRVKGLLTFDGGTLKTDAGITSNRAVVLAAGGGTFHTNTFDSTLSGVVNGTGSLTKAGAGKLALTGVNIHTGETLVSAGTLAVNGNSIANSAKLSITGGQVEVVADETVGALFLGGVKQAVGTYGSTSSTATNPNDTYFTGTGVITVISGYANWAIANAPGQSSSEDYDQEGVQNGMEYFMGATGSGFTALPVPVNGKVTWTKDPAYSGTFMIQTSDTMAADDWDNVPVNGTNPKDNGNSVEYTLPTGQAKLFSRILVTPF